MTTFAVLPEVSVRPAQVGRRPSVRLEALLASLAGLVIAGILKWPVLRHLRTGVPKDLGDPLLQVWQLAWGQHALVHSPLHIWDSNTFFPLHLSLAFSDAMVGYAPFGLLFGDGIGNALLRYNTIFLLTYALAFAGTYALARQLGTSRLAAAVAGVGFAYAPWHLAHEGHLNILSVGGIPLALALLARGHGYGRTERALCRPLLVLAGWAVAAWQVSLGFGLGLQLAYVLGALVVVYGGWWLVQRRKGTAAPVSRRLLLAEAGGMALFLAVAALFAAPYLQAAKEHPEATRKLYELQAFSPPLLGFVTVPDANWLWGDEQVAQRAQLPAPPEMTVAPGGSLVVLAVLGTLVGRWPRRRRALLAAGGVLLLGLAMGTQLGGGRYAYLLLYHYAPGWEGVRTPGRLVVSLTLVLALLAAIGVDRLREAAGRRWLASAGIGVVALTMVALEVLGTTPVLTPPVLPVALDHAAGPLIVLPTTLSLDQAVMYWSAAGLYPVANGSSGFTPVQQDRLRQEVLGFPDAASVLALRRAGIRQVVLLPADSAGTPWQGAEAKPYAGLGLTRRVVADAVVYDVRSAG